MSGQQPVEQAARSREDSFLQNLARQTRDLDLLTGLFAWELGPAAAGDAGGDDLCRLVEALEEQTTRTGGDIAGDESSDNGPADVGDTGMEA